MNRAVIAVADQVIVQELRSRLDQSDADVEVAFVAESTQEMVSSVWPTGRRSPSCTTSWDRAR